MRIGAAPMILGLHRCIGVYARPYHYPPIYGYGVATRVGVCSSLAGSASTIAHDPHDGPEHATVPTSATAHSQYLRGGEGVNRAGPGMCGVPGDRPVGNEE